MGQNLSFKNTLNPQIQINFIVLRKTKDIKLEKLALRYQIPCYTHIDINSKEFLYELKKYSNDLLVSMSFDQIFKEELLKLYPRKISIVMQVNYLFTGIEIY